MEGFYKLRHSGPVAVVQFQTPSLMNSHELEKVGAALFKLVDEDGWTHMVLDFTKVQFLSSPAIGILLTLNRKLNGTSAGGDKLVLCGVAPQLMQLLKLTRLDRLLTIKSDLREALGKKE